MTEIQKRKKRNETKQPESREKNEKKKTKNPTTTQNEIVTNHKKIQDYTPINKQCARYMNVSKIVHISSDED